MYGFPDTFISVFLDVLMSRIPLVPGIESLTLLHMTNSLKEESSYFFILSHVLCTLYKIENISLPFLVP